MDQKKDALQGETDAIEVRAGEIAKREGRHDITEEDRKRAFQEMKETGARAAPPTP